MYKESFETAPFHFTRRCLCHEGSNANLIPLIFEGSKSFFELYFASNSLFQQINKLCTNSTE